MSATQPETSDPPSPPPPIPEWIARANADPEHARRIDRKVADVLVASHRLLHWLKAGHPTLQGTASDGIAYYGGPSAALDLWEACRCLSALSVETSRQPLPDKVLPPPTPSMPPPEPDEAPGLSVESVGEEVYQPRVSNGLSKSEEQEA
jgi:hypothetical protein